MMPWGHFAVAYLPYAVYTLLRHRRLPAKRATLLLLFATQLPDLIDKPLAWSLGVLPSGRMFAHSVVIAVPLVLLLAALAVQFGHADRAPVFTFGYLSHLYADSYTLLWAGADYYFLPNLFWPLVAANPDRVPAFLPHFTRVEPTRYALVALCLLAIAAVYGPAELRRLTRRLHRLSTRARSP